MPRLNVIILDQTPDDPNTYHYVMWADVPVARQARYAQSGKTSAWNGATAADNTNLANGVMTEFAGTQRIPPGSSVTQIENFLQAQWVAFQNQINNYNPWVRYGSTWDGSTWTLVNNS